MGTPSIAPTLGVPGTAPSGPAVPGPASGVPICKTSEIMHQQVHSRLHCCTHWPHPISTNPCPIATRHIAYVTSWQSEMHMAQAAHEDKHPASACPCTYSVPTISAAPSVVPMPLVRRTGSAGGRPEREMERVRPRAVEVGTGAAVLSPSSAMAVVMTSLPGAAPAIPVLEASACVGAALKTGPSLFAWLVIVSYACGGVRMGASVSAVALASGTACSSSPTSMLGSPTAAAACDGSCCMLLASTAASLGIVIVVGAGDVVDFNAIVTGANVGFEALIVAMLAAGTSVLAFFAATGEAAVAVGATLTATAAVAPAGAVVVSSSFSRARFCEGAPATAAAACSGTKAWAAGFIAATAAALADVRTGPFACVNVFFPGAGLGVPGSWVVATMRSQQ